MLLSAGTDLLYATPRGRGYIVVSVRRCFTGVSGVAQSHCDEILTRVEPEKGVQRIRARLEGRYWGRVF
jgi:hypothetical protein